MYLPPLVHFSHKQSLIMKSFIQRQMDYQTECLDRTRKRKCQECDEEGICCKDGQWTMWGSWATCMNMCDPETTTRTRDCDTGDEGCSDISDLACEGSPTDTKDCGHPPRRKFHVTFLL